MLSIIAVVTVYLMPSIIACYRRHRNAVPITLVNALFGWTVIGWFLALIWGMTCNVKGVKQNA